MFEIPHADDKAQSHSKVFTVFRLMYKYISLSDGVLDFQKLGSLVYIFQWCPKVNDFTAHIKCSYFRVSKFVTICGKILVWFKIFFSMIEAIKFLSSALYSSKVKSCKHKKCAQCELQFDWLQKLTPIWFSFLPEGIINIFFALVDEYTCGLEFFYDDHYYFAKFFLWFRQQFLVGYQKGIGPKLL